MNLVKTNADKKEMYSNKNTNRETSQLTNIGSYDHHKVCKYREQF